MTHIEYSATHSGHQNQRPGLTVGYKRVMIGVTEKRSWTPVITMTGDTATGHWLTY